MASQFLSLTAIFRTYWPVVVRELKLAKNRCTFFVILKWDGNEKFNGIKTNQNTLLGDVQMINRSKSVV